MRNENKLAHLFCISKGVLKMYYHFLDDLVGESNGYQFDLYPLKRKGGKEHTPPHLHARHDGHYGKFCICNSYKGNIGYMYEGNMSQKEQEFVKTWIIKYKSKLNRRWRSQNLTRVDSICIRDMDEIQSAIDELQQIEKIVKRLKAIMILRKMQLSVS